MRDIKALTREELSAWFKQEQQPAYRVDQVLNWLYVRGAPSFQAMTNLSKGLRDLLQTSFAHHCLEPVRVQGSHDATRKFLWRLRDGDWIESVLIPASPALYGESSDRHTLCVSTQVGCAYGCKFCASGLDGWKRNLTPDEIVDQVLAVERWLSRPEADAGRAEQAPPRQVKAVGPHDSNRRVGNLVLMGMGEPLANYEHLLKALTLLNAPWGRGIGARKITISTSGLAPQIRRLAQEPHQFRLAISLHGPTDEVRNRIMPVNRKYPLAELTAACLDYQEEKGRMITLEYILIAGINDALELARPLAVLAKKLHAKVNLIPYNQVQGLTWRRPEESVQEAFLSRLQSHKIKATLRREKGHDIDAACGQLRLRMKDDDSVA